jgi:mitogen-activated protein kinase kinase kinase
MGQTLGLRKLPQGNSNETDPPRISTSDSYERQYSWDSTLDGGSDSTEEEFTSDSENAMTALEDLADDFMKTHAFSLMARRYDIPDEYLSVDFPMEETIIDEEYQVVDEKTQKKTDGLGNGMVQANTGQGGAIRVGSNLRWQKGALIGAGSFGRVYLGLNLMTGGFMAVKQVELLRDQIIQHRSEVSSLQNEISVLQSLKHPNIVQYLGTTVEGSCLNIFLEYVPGGSIASLIKKFSAVPEEGLTESLVRGYTKQIVTGLQYLHSNQIIHRDIKGANILVDDKGVIKLADFGASKKIEEIVAQAGAGDSIASLKGTVYWMAPEVIRQSGYGKPADIWSVGCTVIEMATGRPPWSEFADQISALFTIATSDDMPAIPNYFSDEGKDFLAQCFRRNPKERPTASKLLQHPWLLAAAAPSKRASISRSRPGSINLSSSSISHHRYSGSLGASSDEQIFHNSPRSEQSSFTTKDSLSLSASLRELQKDTVETLSQSSNAS